MVNEMQGISNATGLEALVRSERQQLLARVRSGEFGELASFYTPSEQRLVRNAERVEKYFQIALSGVARIAEYLPVIQVNDTPAKTMDETDESTARPEDTQLVVDTGSWIRTLATYSAFSLTARVKEWANSRVAEDFFTRKSAQLQIALAACVQNLISHQLKIEESEGKQTKLYANAGEIRTLYDQREITIADYEATKRTLEEDEAACKSAIGFYHDELMCNAGIESVAEGSNTTKDIYDVNCRLLCVIQHEKYTTAQKLLDEKRNLAGEKDKFESLEKEAGTLINGLQVLYQERELISLNEAQIKHDIDETKQIMITYAACLEMYKFAVVVPDPEKSRTFITSVGQGIEKLLQNYKQKFGLGTDSSGGP